MPNRLDRDSEGYRELLGLINEEKRLREQTEKDFEEFKNNVRDKYLTKELADYLFGWVNKVKGWAAALVGAILVGAFLRLILK